MRTAIILERLQTRCEVLGILAQLVIARMLIQQPQRAREETTRPPTDVGGYDLAILVGLGHLALAIEHILGLCLLVRHSYIEGFFQRYSKLLTWREDIQTYDNKQNSYKKFFHII